MPPARATPCAIPRRLPRRWQDTVPAYGARELRRKVSRAVEQALADRIAAGTARPGVLFVADAAPDGHITLTMGDVAACAS